MVTVQFTHLLLGCCSPGGRPVWPLLHHPPGHAPASLTLGRVHEFGSVPESLASSGTHTVKARAVKSDTGCSWCVLVYFHLTRGGAWLILTLLPLTSIFLSLHPSFHTLRAGIRRADHTQPCRDSAATTRV